MKFGSFYLFEESPAFFDRALSKNHAAYLYFHALPKEEQEQLKKESIGMEKEELIGFLSARAAAGEAMAQSVKQQDRH